MTRLSLLLCALFLIAGCAGEDKAQWDAVWKDARGENMQMRGNFSDAVFDDHPLQPK